MAEQGQQARTIKQNKWVAVRFIATFVVILAIGFGLLMAPVTQPAMVNFTAHTVKVCAVLVRLFGGQAATRQNFLFNPKNGFSIEIKDTCNATNVTLLLWAAILAFPAPWKQKGKGVAVGTLAIHAINQIRLISLFYLGQYNQQWFDFAHLYVWESLIMLATMVIFSVWVRQLRPARS